MPDGIKYTVDELAGKIKNKYPDYKDMDNQELVDKIIAKHPEYENQLKKKETSEIPSEVPPQVSSEDSQEQVPTSILDLLEEGKDESISTFVGELPAEELVKPERKEVSLVEEAPTYKQQARKKEAYEDVESYLKTTRDKATNSIIEFQTKGVVDPYRKTVLTAAIASVEDKFGEMKVAYEKGKPISRPYFEANVLGSPSRRIIDYEQALFAIPKEERTLEKAQEIADEHGLVVDKDGMPFLNPDEVKAYSDEIAKEYKKLIDQVPGDSFTNDMADAFAKGMSGLTANTLDLLGYAGLNLINGYSDLSEGQRIRAKQFESQIERSDRGVIDAVNEKEYGKALGNAVLQITESAPTLASLAMGNAAGYGNAALVYLGAEQAAGRYDELEDIDMSETGKIVNSIIWGLAEAVPEKFGTSAALHSAQAAIKSGVKREVVEDILKRSYSTQFNKSISNIVGYTNPAIRGGIDEMTTTAVQNIMDNRELTEGMGDSFVVGFLTDAIISAPALGITTAEEARSIAVKVMNSVPKNMPLEDKMNAASLIVDKKVAEKAEETLDNSFKGTSEDAVENIDNAIKLTTLDKSDKYSANEIKKKIDDELSKDSPNPEVLVSLNNSLNAIESKSGAILSGGNQETIDKSVKNNTPEEIVSSITAIQKERTVSYDKAFGDLDSEINSELNKENKAEGEEIAKEADSVAKTPEVAKEPVKEEKVAEKAPEVPKKEEIPPKEKVEKPTEVVKEEVVEEKPKVEPKLKEDESKKISESVSEEDTKEKSRESAEEVKEEGILEEKPAEVKPEQAELPDNVIETKEGLFELNEGQVEQRKEMIKKYGKERADELIKDFIDVNDLKKYNVTIGEKTKEDAKELEGGEVRIEGEQIKEQKVSDKDMPKIDGTELQDRAKVEIEKKIGKIEKLDQKRKESVQKGLDSIGRIGNIQFALDEAGKKQAIQEIATAVKEFTKAGVITAEIGTLKAIDFVKNQFKGDVKAQKFIDDNKQAIQDAVEGKKKVEVKERRLGKKALATVDLPEEFKADLAEKGIEYAVRGRVVTDAESEQIADAYIKEGRADELKSVILDTTNDIPADTRTALAVKYAKRSLDEANKATNEKERKAYRDDALDVFYMDMQQSTQQAQALQAKARWAEIVATEPDLFVEYAKKEQRKQNDKRLESRKGDIKTSQQVIEDYLKSKEFKEQVEEKSKNRYDELVNQGKQSKNRRERGKAKFADGLNKVVTSIGVKKNAIADNEMKPDWLEGVKEMADGLLDMGVGSTAQLISKIKVALREYISPNEIDKYQAKIIKETNAEKRVKKPVKKKDTLTEKELNELVDKLYEKMVGGDKSQIRMLAKDYLDRLVEGGALDEQSFKDLFAKSIGLEHLRAEDEVKLRDMATKLSDLRSIKNNLESLFKKFVVTDLAIHQAKKKGDITPEMQKDYDKLRKEIDTQVKEYNKSLEGARQANKEISDFFADPKTTADLLSTFIQGNLLTPISLVTNVVANTTMLPIRGLKFAIASGLDMALSGIGAVKEDLLEKYKDNPRVKRLLNKLPNKERTYDLMGSARGYIPGFNAGTLEGLRQMKTGQLPEDAYIREIGKSLKPLKAAIDVIAVMKGEEKARATKVFNNTIEAILGAPPEVMFRLLNLGDKPFRRAAERARLEEIAAIKGLKGAAKEAFITFPDDTTLEEMRKAGLEATYQQDNVIANFILHGAKKGKAKEILDKIDKKHQSIGKLIVKTQIPYVKTPTNIAIEAMDYALPLVSLYKAYTSAVKGDRRRALDYVSRAMVGLMIESAITSMFVAGLFTFAPQGLEEDESQKVRESEFASGKLPYYLNSDAVLRWLSGEDTAYQEGDDLWSMKRLGITSALMMGKLESFRGKSPEEIAEMSAIDRRLGAFFATFKSALDQSFVSGINNLINAFMGSEYERMNWFVGTAKALEATALPNTYAALNKWRDGYIRETKNRHLKGIDRIKADITQDFKASYLNSDGLPTKVSIWGERVTRVPDGRGLGFVLFDITQSREYKRTFGMEVHELYERTRDKSVLPSQPSRRFKYDGEEFMLTNKMYEDLQIRLNSINAKIIQPIVESQTWDGLTDERKLAKMKGAYKKIESKKSYAKGEFKREWKYELEELAEKEKK